MSKKLPFLVSIPHGGDKIPPELRGRICLSDEDIFWDSDACTRTIYASADLVHTQVETDIARAAVDLGRDPDDRPPKNPDGVVKQQTCMGVDLYRDGAPPDSELAQTLIARYHAPWHRRLETLVRQEQLILGLDCHSMLAEAPPIAPDQGPRPTFCVGNRKGASCRQDWLILVAECLTRSFELAPDEVQLNVPFQGGYITRSYGGNPLPWLQIEMSRALYLREPWFERHQRTVDPERLAWLNVRFRRALTDLAEQLAR